MFLWNSTVRANCSRRIYNKLTLLKLIWWKFCKSSFIRSFDKTNLYRIKFWVGVQMYSHDIWLHLMSDLDNHWCPRQLIINKAPVHNCDARLTLVILLPRRQSPCHHWHQSPLFDQGRRFCWWWLCDALRPKKNQ